MAFAIPFPSVANNGTGETEAVVSHLFLPAKMQKVRQALNCNDVQCDMAPMVGELMFTNPTLTRKLNSREKNSQQCVVATQRCVNIIAKTLTDPADIENWRFIGSFLNEMGGRYNIIVSRKASLLCPFEMLIPGDQNMEVATLDTVVLAYANKIDHCGITVRTLPPGRKLESSPESVLVPIGTVMFPPVRSCMSLAVKAIEETPENKDTAALMTKLPILVVELGTYV